MKIDMGADHKYAYQSSVRSFCVLKSIDVVVGSFEVMQDNTEGA
jgi:hypothetical protein